MLHQGSSSVDRAEIRQCPHTTSNSLMATHCSRALLHTTEQTLSRFTFQITGESHGLSRNGSRYFGLQEIENDDQAADFRCVRNSHDRTFPAGICVASSVLVCDNLMFAGEIALARKHTRFILRDLPLYNCCPRASNAWKLPAWIS
jgi:hypothetical protein